MYLYLVFLAGYKKGRISGATLIYKDVILIGIRRIIEVILVSLYIRVDKEQDCSMSLAVEV